MSAAIPPVALTIAGSDSGGGAGIQADLKTFTALGVFGTTAIASITAQNTLGVHAIHDLPTDLVRAQIRAVMDDLHPSAIKSGMLSSEAIIETVAAELESYAIANYVLDPVMISESGHVLLQPEAKAALTERLLPLALILTPNKAEAEALSGIPIETEAGMCEAARILHALGPKYVLVKGGHMGGNEAIDILHDGKTFERIAAERIDTANLHGTGCTYAAAIAAHLAKGLNATEAVREAKAYVTGAIRQGFNLGAGPGPLNHFWQSHTARGKKNP